MTNKKSTLKYRLAIFDLDGTILDTLADLTASVNYALERFGYPTRTAAEVRRFLGNGSVVLMTKSLPAGTSEADRNKVLDFYNDYYQAHCNLETRPYEGIPELFSKLRSADCKIAVVSNKPDSAVQVLCREHFCDSLDAATGQRSDVRKKPAPDAINDILNKLSIDRKDSVYVGDSEVDIATAGNAAMDCISVEWGFRDRDFLMESGATVVASDVAELAQMLGIMI